MPASHAPAAVTRLGVDARGLHTTGIGRYTREILAGLIQDGRIGTIVAFGDPDELRAFLAEREARTSVEVVPYGASWFSRRTQTEWLSHRAAGRTRADIWFFPVPDVPLLAHPRRSVATVLDLTVLNAPRPMHGLKGRLAARLSLHGVTTRCTALIAISEYTCRDIVRRVPSVSGRVHVVHLGVDRHFRPVTAGERSAQARVAALGPFLLGVGNRTAHKNWRLAIDALRILNAAGQGLRLVMAGGRRGEHWEENLRYAQECGLGGALVELNDVSEDELRVLYSSCEAFLFPSVYEGFGLPVLEAMACGAPVIAANRTALPEVVGDAGFLVEPDDPASAAAIVARLRSDPALRSEYARRGQERAGLFRWDAAARRITDLLLQTAVSPARVAP